MSDAILAGSVSPSPSRSISAFEYAPGWLFYTPVVLFWLLQGFRHGSFTLPSAANPRITTGGLCGESKSSILDAAGPTARPWIAPYISFVTGDDDHRRAVTAIVGAGLSLPLVVKPDIGCNGAGVMLVQTEERLKLALAAFDRGVTVLLQEFVSFEGEAGLFYSRMPGEPRGRITSLTYKQAPVLRGDGASTLRELILQDERMKQISHIYMPRLGDRLDHIPRDGEEIRPVFTGNHCKGSLFTDGSEDITDRLTNQLDLIMQDLPEFHFGRVDVRFSTRSALRDGQAFRIIEVNGVGSEATHIWDPQTSLWSAYQDQFSHYADAFRIGAEMRKRGVTPCSPFTMLRHWRNQRRLMRSYPMND